MVPRWYPEIGSKRRITDGEGAVPSWADQAPPGGQTREDRASTGGAFEEEVEPDAALYLKEEGEEAR